ncbi:YceH family protein [Pedobacter arcticus]|uniref:YceH family protein n=1 Tax=Pedobacter arcticus TaxID=752140 RepID=UPI0002DA64DD|nr:YceH family protein [Pedobacter arcticus]
MEPNKTLPILSSTEIRVLGALMEKSKTTPDYYPMTLNGLTAACNQKSSRKPVVEYDEETVVLALDSLKKKGLTSTATGGSSRATKYKHNFAIVYPVVPSQVAVMALLFLRGALTPGEINSNSGRLYEFDSLDDVQEVLEQLSSDETPFIVQIPKRAGQKEARYVHLFAGEPDLNYEDEAVAEPARKSVGELEARIATLEENYAQLKTDFDKLMKEWIG